jgi:hypothetical protein
MDRNPWSVGFIDQSAELIGCAVTFLYSEEIDRVVTPGQITFELEDRHQLERVDAQVLQIIHLAKHSLEVSFSSEVAHMHLAIESRQAVAMAQYSIRLALSGALHTEDGRVMTVRAAGLVARAPQSVKPIPARFGYLSYN